MCLSEIGNVASKLPHSNSLADAWPETVHLTYVQAYTPLLKPMDESRLFHDHPFLLTMLLGREYVRTHHKFRHLVECTDALKEFEELVATQIIQTPRVLKNARSFNQACCSIHSVIDAASYVSKAFNPDLLPARNRLTSFLRMAVDLTNVEEMEKALAKALLEECVYVPRAVHFESVVSLSVTSFHVLSKVSLRELITKVTSRMK